MLDAVKERTLQPGVFQETAAIGVQQVVIRGAVVTGILKLGTVSLHMGDSCG